MYGLRDLDLAELTYWPGCGWLITPMGRRALELAEVIGGKGQQ